MPAKTTTTTNTDEPATPAPIVADQKFWEALTAPFPADEIEILPKPYRRDSQKGRCEECGGYHGLPAVHLSYVGHAGLTMRLNAVCGPHNWEWEPMALSPLGTPLISDGCLWIKLRVRTPSGIWVEKLGVGDAEGKQGVSAPKEMIGDAMRNAAMRFGIATYLWGKSDAAKAMLARGSAEHQVAGEPDAPATQAREQGAQSRQQATQAQGQDRNSDARRKERWVANQAGLMRQLTVDQLNWLREQWDDAGLPTQLMDIPADRAAEAQRLISQAAVYRRPTEDAQLPDPNDGEDPWNEPAPAGGDSADPQ